MPEQGQKLRRAPPRFTNDDPRQKSAQRPARSKFFLCSTQAKSRHNTRIHCSLVAAESFVLSPQSFLLFAVGAGVIGMMERPSGSSHRGNGSRPGVANGTGLFSVGGGQHRAYRSGPAGGRYRRSGRGSAARARRRRAAPGAARHPAAWRIGGGARLRRRHSAG